jgi:hypothetical protein
MATGGAVADAIKFFEGFHRMGVVNDWFLSHKDRHKFHSVKTLK